MVPEGSQERNEIPPAPWFTTTHWSIVVTAGDGASPDADVALNRLCRTYWWLLYAFVRRRGYAAHDAQDLTQDFFARLLAKDYLRAVDRSKGKFRSFLLAALEHFLANEWRRANTQKRSGNFSFVSIDDETAERPCLQLPDPEFPPGKIFERSGQRRCWLRPRDRPAESGYYFEMLAGNNEGPTFPLHILMLSE